MADESKQQEVSTENRRRHQRVKVAKPVKLEATLRGRFIDIMRLEMSGVTIDMSKGGILATVDQSISPGVRCRVDLTTKDGDSPSQSLWARVRRTDMVKNGFVVALEFDEPVKALAALGAPASDESANGDGSDEGTLEETLELDAADMVDEVGADSDAKGKRKKGKTGRG